MNNSLFNHTAKPTINNPFGAPFNGDLNASMGGSQPDAQRSGGVSKHYTESTRLTELFRLYSTLEERPLAEDIEDEFEKDRKAD